jgi:hypothetical protein
MNTKYTKKFSVTGIFRGTQWVLFKLGIIPCQARLVNGIILERAKFFSKRKQNSATKAPRHKEKRRIKELVNHKPPE